MTDDELRDAVTQWISDRSDPGWLGVPPSARPLADFAAAMLDPTLLDREWLVKVLGEPEDEYQMAEWCIAPERGPYVDMYGSGKCEGQKRPNESKHLLETRADAIAFFRLVRWPVDWEKVLEAAQCGKENQ